MGTYFITYAWNANCTCAFLVYILSFLGASKQFYRFYACVDGTCPIFTWYYNDPLIHRYSYSQIN